MLLEKGLRHEGFVEIFFKRGEKCAGGVKNAGGKDQGPAGD
jgi:hypothetical protein